eukprot:SAG25_NODE_6504_length_554_cov_1.160440_2_plen_59_part_01
MAKMLEAMFEQSIKNFDETIKHPEQAVAELKAALDEVSSRTHKPVSGPASLVGSSSCS